MKSGKRTFIIWLVVLIAVAALCYFFASVLPDMISSEKENDNTYLVDIYNYFYEPEWNVPLEEREGYEEYSGYDRTIHIKDGNVTRGITADNEQTFRKEELFFKDYFKALCDGDADAYNALCTSSYLAENGETDDFTAQMIYDIVAERAESSQSGSSSQYTFYLFYKIYRNDGTFRKDVYSDAEKAVRIVIDDSEGSVKIKSVK